MGGSLHPAFRNDLFSLPFPLLEIKLSKLGHILCTEEKPPAAFCDPGRTGFPEILCDSQRLKKPWLQIFGQGFPSALCDNGRQHIGVHAVVLKNLTGSSVYCRIQIAGYPVISGYNTGFIKGDPTGHGQEIFHCDHRPENFQQGIDLIRKNIINIFIQAKLPLLNQQSYSHSGDAFAHRMGNVPHAFGVRRKITLADHLSVAESHEVMHFRALCMIQLPDQGCKILRGNSLALRSRPLKGLLIRGIKRKVLFLRKIIYTPASCFAQNNIKN